MGEAKRRKLAGTYPPQDGGPWRYYGADFLHTMPPEILPVFDELLDGFVENQLMNGGPLDLDPTEPPDAPRRVILWMVEHGLVLFALRFAKDGVQFDIVPSMPRDDVPDALPLPLPGLPR